MIVDAVTEDGARLVEDALVAKLVDSGDVFFAMTDKQRDVVARAAGPAFALQTLATNGKIVPEANLIDAIPTAIRVALERGAKGVEVKAGGGVERMASPESLFVTEATPREDAVANLFIAGFDQPQRFGVAWRRLADKLSEGQKGSKDELDVFGGDDFYAPNVHELINVEIGNLVLRKGWTPEEWVLTPEGKKARQAEAAKGEPVEVGLSPRWRPSLRCRPLPSSGPGCRGSCGR
jgi:hypothetical protein